MRKKIVRASLPVFYYALGMASLFAVDILISKYGGAISIGQWAYLKSAALLVGFFALLGGEQSILRNFERIGKDYVRVVALRGLILVLMASFIFSKPNFSNSQLAFFLLACCVVFSSLATALARSKLYFVQAQVASNAWKIFLLIVIALFVGFDFNVETNSVIIISAAIGIVVAVIIIFNNSSSLSFEKSPLSRLNKDGIKFLVMGGTLNLSVNLEQIILQYATGDELLAAGLFAHLTSFGGLFLFVNGFYGFVLAPIVKLNRYKINNRRNGFILFNLLIAMCLSVVAYFLGRLIFNWVYSEKVELNELYALVVIFIFCLRFLYVIPSSFIGFSGAAEVFNKYLRINISSLIVLVVAFVLIYYVTNEAVLSVLLASGLNWIIRTLSGLVLTLSIEKK